MNPPILKASKKAFINAPIEHVWAIQTDIAKWPEWQPDVSFAQIDQSLEKGSTFRWKAMGMNITSTLEKVDEMNCISWSGNSIGMTALHSWYFQKEGNKTVVKTEEELSGWLARVLKFFDPQFLDKSLEKALETLKKTSEKRDQ